MHSFRTYGAENIPRIFFSTNILLLWSKKRLPINPSPFFQISNPQIPKFSTSYILKSSNPQISKFSNFQIFKFPHPQILKFSIFESTPKSTINWILSGVEGCKHLIIRTLRLRSVSGFSLNCLFGVDSISKFCKFSNFQILKFSNFQILKSLPPNRRMRAE